MALGFSLGSMCHSEAALGITRSSLRRKASRRDRLPTCLTILSLAPLFGLKLGLCIIETQLELLLKLRVVLNDLKKEPRGVKIDQVEAFL